MLEVGSDLQEQRRGWWLLEATLILGMKEELRDRGKYVTGKLREALIVRIRPVPCPRAHYFTLHLGRMCSHFPEKQGLVL